MSESLPTPQAPKITQALALRTLFLVLVLGGSYFGYDWFKKRSEDPTYGQAKTSGWLAAIQIQSDGQQAVAFSPDGKMTASSGWKTGNTDRDITWDPSGNRVFFVSDREDNNFHIFRWNPTDGSDPVRRTIGSRSRGVPEFPRQPMENADASALITSGGYILEYRPKDLSTVQVLPPLGREIVQGTADDEGGGASDQFSGVYSKLGNSFKIARWCKNKTWIAATMRRDEGEILVIQNMQPNAEGNLPRPQPIVAGDHVDFDVNPADGTVVFSVENFQWPNVDAVPPQFRKGDKITRPYAHFVGKLDPDNNGAMTPIAGSDDDHLCFGAPTISPDGASLVLTEGKYENSTISSATLVTMPTQQMGYRLQAILASGTIFEPAWSQDGTTVAFAQDQPSGKRSIMTVRKDGSGLLNLTGDVGNFSNPVYSPQAKTAQ